MRWDGAIAAAAIVAAVAAGCGPRADGPPDAATMDAPGKATLDTSMEHPALTPLPQAVVGAACAAVKERGAVVVSVKGESRAAYADATPRRWTADAQINGEDYRHLFAFEGSGDHHVWLVEPPMRDGQLAALEGIGVYPTETIRAGDHIYQRSGFSSGGWDNWAMRKAATVDRDKFLYPFPVLTIDPAAETCEHAKASAFRHIGEETVGGRLTQRFTVDFAAQYAEAAEYKFEGELRDIRDFWIDDAGRIAQVRFDYFSEGFLDFPPSGETISVAVYSNFGGPNAVSAPPNVALTPTPTPHRTPTPHH